ncbi:flagellar hook-associated protein 2 [Fictibacillus nanhaiensis]|uniref:flagellar hook-associated protein 2 n=1 Tax=Fictibacillus nanhaiensis TaxID=742169 RepID=UPI001C9809C8|nr:flagellar hook-associated protein 2 [Fictibacillus nanhaiensis]MBY6037038.1 flagellar hook-associated protein 2 [Fictibacillus nanhaiensis]
MRIGGLASGMDIDTLVGDLMKAERIPLDKLAQKKTTLEWQRDDYRSMNKLLSDLDKQIFDGIALQGKFSTKSVTSSNSSIVSAKASSSAVNTNTSIEVLNTATPAMWVSGGTVAAGYTASADITLTFNVTSGDGKTTSAQTVDIKNGDNLDKIVSQFNSSGLGVTAFYDDQKQKFVITKKDTGDNASITVNNDAGTQSFMVGLGFTDAAVNGEITTTGKTNGKDADFKINGYQTTRSTNTFDISGVTYTLQQAGTANITVANDTNSTFDMIKSFVDKYNETIEAINKKTAETKYRDFPPLTDAQRKDLSEKEAELWDEKAKSGMLRGDSILLSGLNAMRSDLYASVNTGDTNYDQLSEIGITTSPNYLDKGKLILDETKLRAALAGNPDAVMKLFTGDGTEKGVAKKLRETIDSTVDKIELKAGNALRTNAQFTLGRELTDVDKRISAFEDRLIQVEDRYWRQFQAMEAAIQRSNQQGAYLMQQFGGGQ